MMELIFNPCGEFRWSPEGPVSQIHSPHLHVGVPGIFSDLLRSVEILKRDWSAESNRKLLHFHIPGKTAALVPEFTVKDMPSAELQLQWRTCPWSEHWWLYMKYIIRVFSPRADLSLQTQEPRLQFCPKADLPMRWRTCLRQNCSLGTCACSEGPWAQHSNDDI